MARATSLREQVEDAIAAAIVTGELAPGELVSAPVLATRYGVSATPVREAMLNLEARGFVTTVRNKGFRVTEVHRDDVASLIAVRRLLEPPAVGQLAAERHELVAEHAPRLRSLADAIVAGARSGDLVAYLRADTLFHSELLALLGNRHLVQVVGQLRSQTRLIGLATAIGTPKLEQSAVEHYELLDLVLAGDAAAAEAYMSHHVSAVLDWWAPPI
ncbi:DNA-binding transcriptional regulator, GntR family [Quadrisphaera granulorum]|uniref:DNA-binding GntR family transcriptional regulator n=1 Tax=Quadrisphaera granulorum TaxID=317664 RepID=A0A315ZYE9_9ACTN|nr:DNA-binding GntR family transcriptional regulator [Quadrisphaera granulorum]SZE98123.1 DNA-binding transcriptional regulator, GntR family [Quadrisphaera granulorum]